ncbi:MAG TPA: phosphate ABC transporter permease subunit PstC [Terriglobia bacterium]|nr:phosphate ABC transporter permease subunit PstC [Terriglobia bacterium]
MATGPIVARSRALTPWVRARSFLRHALTLDAAAYTLTLLAATTIFLITLLVCYELYIQSALARETFGWKFLFTQAWNPITEKFGALPFIYGTVVTSAMALLIAIPQGLGAAIFLAEMAPPHLSDALTFLIELLAAVPSVIYGLLGIFVLVPVLDNFVVPALQSSLGFLPIFKGVFYGVSYFSAGVVLSIMIIPFIVSVSREVLLAVPLDQREASMALGASRWQTTWRVVVPFALKGITGSIFLALARALGETMAVTMVIGNTPQIKVSLLASGYSIAAIIANEFTEAAGDLYTSALIELALVLFAVTFIINGLARLLIIATTKQGAQA